MSVSTISLMQAARLISHPLRLELLRRYSDAEQSPSDLSNVVVGRRLSRQGLGPIGNVSYHTRILARAGAVKQTKTKQVRGAVEHYYRTSEAGSRVLALADAWESTP